MITGSQAWLLTDACGIFYGLDLFLIIKPLIKFYQDLQQYRINKEKAIITTKKPALNHNRG